MKLKAIYKKSETKQISKEDRVIAGLLFTSEMIINTISPFISGMLLGNTRNLLWLIPLILAIVLQLKIEYKNKKFTINIIKKI